MKYVYVLSLCAIALFFTACSDKPKEAEKKAVENPAEAYLDSRTDAMSLAKKSVRQSNKRTQEQEKTAEEALK
jgi:PBP1b-binding outer membrane lipoprotein LpoB